MENLFFDIVFIGAGPATIIAISELIETTSKYEICIIDRGKSSFQRECPLRAYNACRKCPSCMVVEGFGGSGMFSDGKLHRSSDDLSLRVFQHLENHGLPPYHPSEEIIEKNSVLQERIKNVNLSYFGYLSQHAGTKKIISITQSFERCFVDAGIELHFEHRVISIEKKNQRYQLQCQNSEGDTTHIFGSIIVMATGKAGQEQIETVAPELQGKMDYYFPDIGVRFEFPRNSIQSITEGVILDPQVSFKDGKGNRISTFCSCTGGEVVPYRRNKMLMLGGQSNIASNRPLSNFALLCSLTYQDNIKYWSHHDDVKFYQLNKPIIQKLNDFFAQRCSAEIDMNSTTLPCYTVGNIHNLLPQTVTSLIVQFITRLNKTDAGFMDSKNILSSPVLEPRNLLDTTIEYLPMSHPGLFVIGDVTGRAGGIVAAAKTGLALADKILHG